MFVITAEQPGAVGKEASWLASERTEQRSQPARGTYGVHCCRPLTAATSRKASRPRQQPLTTAPLPSTEDSILF